MLVDNLKWRYWDIRTQRMGFLLPYRIGFDPDARKYMANTGLLDANDKEIWEGDIVFMGFDRGDYTEAQLERHAPDIFNYKGSQYYMRGSVEFKRDENTFMYTELDDEEWTVDSLPQPQRFVVGNIYKHPTLLSMPICNICHTFVGVNECGCSSKSSGHQVSMTLTDKDVENAEKLKKKLQCNNNAEAVSAALSITASLADRLRDGEQLFKVRPEHGEQLERLFIPGLTIPSL